MLVILKPTKVARDNTKLCGIVELSGNKPIIGSKWNGKPADFVDSQAGVYWQSMPSLNETEKRIQAGLLDKRVTLADTFEAYVLTQAFAKGEYVEKMDDAVAGVVLQGETYKWNAT
jgi:hypothetical protein